MAATALIDHLVGKSVMQDEVRREWEAACPKLRKILQPDKLLYCWRNRIYRWPDLPMTVAGQQANFSYPAFLAIRAIEAMYAYGDSCYCRVTAWVEELWSYHRTGRPEFDEVIVGNASTGDGRPIEMMDAFHREHWEEDPGRFRAQIEANPSHVVADYLHRQLKQLKHSGFRPDPLRRPRQPPSWVLRL